MFRFPGLEGGKNHLKRRSFFPPSKPPTQFLGWWFAGENLKRLAARRLFCFTFITIACPSKGGLEFAFGELSAVAHSATANHHSNAEVFLLPSGTPPLSLAIWFAGKGLFGWLVRGEFVGMDGSDSCRGRRPRRPALVI